MIGRRKARKDLVTDELMVALWSRDLGCVMAFLEPGHICTNRWGDRCSWNDPESITVEHVHEGYGMKGKRAKSDLDHTVLLCAGTNIGVPSKVQRGLIRDYLAARRAA